MTPEQQMTNESSLLLVNSSSSSSSSSSCPLLGLIPFSNERFEDSQDYQQEQHMLDFGFTHMAAALLAMDHFNTRNPAVVPELVPNDLLVLANCRVQLPDPVFVNTNGIVDDTVEYLVTVAGNQLCGIVGPFHNGPTLAAANFALGLGVPLLSHGCSDSQLGRQYPLTGRTVTKIDSLSEIIISVLKSYGRNDCLATVGPISEDGHGYLAVMDQQVKLAGWDHHDLYAYQPALEHTFLPNQGIGCAIQQIKESGYRNIFFTMFHVGIQLPLFAQFAEQFGMLIGEYLWIMGGEVDFKEVLEVASTNINVTKLVRGMVSVRWLDGFKFDPDNDRMLQAWRQQNESFVNRLNALHPVQNSTAAGYFQAPLDYFQTTMPQRGAGFIYDAVMSMGFGKCKELAPDDKNLGGDPSLDSNIFEHLEDKLNGVRPDGVTYLLPEENDPIRNRRRVKGEKSHPPAA